jgi:hypothetical protein
MSDLIAARKPDACASGNVLEKSLEAANAARTADDAQVQADNEGAEGWQASGLRAGPPRA